MIDDLLEQALWHIQQAAKHNLVELNVLSAEGLIEKVLEQLNATDREPTASVERILDADAGRGSRQKDRNSIR